MEGAPKTGVEIENTFLGKVKLFGMDLNTLFTVLVLASTCGLSVFMYMHNAVAESNGKEAKKSSSEVAQTLKDSNKEVASVLKETSKEVANVLKETSKENTLILKEMASAIREQSSEIRQQNCLASLPPNQPAAQRQMTVDLCRKVR